MQHTTERKQVLKYVRTCVCMCVITEPVYIAIASLHRHTHVVCMHTHMYARTHTYNHNQQKQQSTHLKSLKKEANILGFAVQKCVYLCRNVFKTLKTRNGGHRIGTFFWGCLKIKKFAFS